MRSAPACVQARSQYDFIFTGIGPRLVTRASLIPSPVVHLPLLVGSLHAVMYVLMHISLMSKMRVSSSPFPRTLHTHTHAHALT